MARRSIVLLKNDGAVLPLRKDVGTVAVIGPLADDAASALGAWAGAGRPDDAVTPLAGIRQALGTRGRVLVRAWRIGRYALTRQASVTPCASRVKGMRWCS